MSELTSGENMPTGKLFSVGQIVLATFIGTPIAGFLLLAKNYMVLGKKESAVQSLLGGIISTVLVFALSFVLPDRFPNFVIPVSYCAGMREFTKYLQGQQITDFQSVGKIGSWLTPVLIGILCLSVVVLLVFLVVFVLAL